MPIMFDICQTLSHNSSIRIKLLKTFYGSFKMGKQEILERMSEILDKIKEIDMANNP